MCTDNVYEAHHHQDCNTSGVCYYVVAMIVPVVILSMLAGLVGAAYLTNPFSKFTVIKQPFTVRVILGTFKAVNQNHRLVVRQNWWWRLFATLKCWVHIIETRYVRSPRSSATTLTGIINDIHTHRFKPDRLLLTSGDHFSGLFVRNLGVFYYPMVDPAIPGSTQDWHNRQIVYLQTVAYALGVFEKNPIPTTTIVTTGAYRATCVNYWRYPSDTVYGMLFALAALSGKERPAPASYAPRRHRSNTHAAAVLLIAQYKSTLKTLYTHYRKTTFDTKRMLQKRDVAICGAKDITRRECAFYDNVVFWKTTELAMKLGLIKSDPQFLKNLKANIIKTFWLEEEGYFLDDVSAEGMRDKFYSSDWLIVLITGFLDPAKEAERAYFTRSVAHIQKTGIDKPFAIKYQQESRGHKQFFLARIAFASYQRDTVWSFWGMEYIKVLLLLYKHTGDQAYLQTADTHLESYQKAMLRDGGFPEVYDTKGELYETFMYRSVRQTGWVIGFEQACAMRASMAGQR